MSITTKYVGLDVSKSKIAVAIADEGRGEARYWGTITHTKEAVGKLMQQLSKSEDITLEVCYEAGPTGYVLYRWLLEMNISCTIVAPSLIPKRAGDRVKTDKRDALRLAQLFRAGELTPVYIPTPADEALRDLVRAREDAKEDLARQKQRLGKFLLRNQLASPKGSTPWTHAYEAWLDSLKFADHCQQVTFQEYRQSIWETKERIRRYEQEIERQAESCAQAPLIQALQALRGVAVLTATTLASEMIEAARFPLASAFMSYCGLVPSENSTGDSRRQGKITKAGNAHLRRVLVEAAWSYRYSPAVKKKMRQRILGLPPEVQRIAWKAQHRLHQKYKSLLRMGKHKGAIAVAIARELAGFVWAIAKEVEMTKAKAS
ncbi:IS110 family transposase [Paenibacillus antibioticophila]|uniref:IS110 family transposase n=1 Tax=Paenibacillus antibioticophila TaxID=1274374 RepID=A0A919XN54_9BACL|nr:IS110 family transposase [Paenibacillus antibioticophila]GIO35824.1 IS110 family transposase [Paenibacillus antibioticophila]